MRNDSVESAGSVEFSMGGDTKQTAGLEIVQFMQRRCNNYPIRASNRFQRMRKRGPPAPKLEKARWVALGRAARTTALSTCQTRVVPPAFVVAGHSRGFATIGQEI